MKLGDVLITTRERKPITMLLHGEHGEGKTTFGETAPRPLFIAGEDIDQVESARLPKCATWKDFITQLNLVKSSPHEPFDTLVIDTIDAMAHLLYRDITKSDGTSSSMATACGGYGKAYDLAAMKMLAVREEFLAPIRDQGKNILILCHTTAVTVEDPDLQATYERKEPCLHTKKNGGIKEIFEDWVSIIGYITTPKTKVGEGSSGKKSLLISSDIPEITLRRRPHVIAKNRFDLPPQVGPHWQYIQDGVDAFFSPAKTIKDKLRNIVAMIPPSEERDIIINEVKTAGADVSVLQSILDRLLTKREGEENVTTGRETGSA